MTTFAYTTGNPANLTGGATASMNDIQGPFTDLRTFLNGGNLTTPNVAPAGLADSVLASPNNAIWRTLADRTFMILASLGAATYWFTSLDGSTVASGNAGYPAPVLLDPAEFVVAGKTAKLRLRVNLVTGGAPGIAPVFAMYVISALGGTNNVTVTLGATVPGSTATFPGLVTGGAASTQVSGSFDFPTSGQYMFGVNLPAPTAANSVMAGRMQLAISHV